MGFPSRHVADLTRTNVDDYHESRGRAAPVGARDAATTARKGRSDFRRGGGFWLIYLSVPLGSAWTHHQLAASIAGTASVGGVRLGVPVPRAARVGGAHAARATAT